MKKDPIKISKHNGYNNQPFFINNTEFLYVKDDSTSNTDIWKMNINNFIETQITKTADEQEYSPTPILNAKRISTVRIDKDEKQRLYQFNFDGNIIQCYNDSLTDIGYHTWINDTLYAGFFVGNPEKLYLKSTKNYSKWLIDKPGRGFKYIKKEDKLYFIDKRNENEFWLKYYDFKTEQIVTLIPMLKGVEDLSILNWRNTQYLIFAYDNVIFYYDSKENKFEALFDTALKNGKITRISSSPNGRKMIVVMNKTN